MLAFTFAVVSFAVILAASALPQNLPHNDLFSETHECVPDTQFIDVCNRCYCDGTGKMAICTKMNCPIPEKPIVDGYKDGFSCLPGKTFYDGCKECVCSESGKAAECSAVMDCVDAPRRRRSVPARPKFPHIDNFSESKVCTPGKTFYEQCNICVCSADGKSAGCTLMGCIAYNEIHIDNYVQGTKCPAGKNFYDKCNTCACSADGLSAACTRVKCPEFD